MSASPEEVVWNLLRGALTARALAVVAELDVAGALANGPRPAAEVAAEVGADAETLHRFLRALASDGVFVEHEPGVFGNTPASEQLTAGSGWHAFAQLFGDVFYRGIGALDASGDASFPKVLGTDFWSWLAENPKERALREVPVLRMLNEPVETVRTRAARLAGAVGGEVEETVGRVGGGALPLAELPSFACAVEESLAEPLRLGEPPVVGVIRDGRLLLDCRTLTDAEADEATAAVRAAR